jgi:hypothetical protein
VGFQEDTPKSIEWHRHNVQDPASRNVGESPTRASAEKEELIVKHLDLEKVEFGRTHWPFLRDRRIDAYGGLVKRFADQTVCSSGRSIGPPQRSVRPPWPSPTSRSPRSAGWAFAPA